MINANRAALIAALKRILPATTNAKVIGILGHVVLEAKGGVLTLYASNMIVVMQSSVPCTGNLPRTTADARKFLDLLSGMNQESVELSEKGYTLTIKDSRAKATLKGLDPNDFPIPEMRPDKEGSVFIPTSMLRDALKTGSGFSARVHNVAALTGSRLALDKHFLTVESSDGISMSRHRNGKPPKGTIGATIPASSVAMIEGLLERSEAESVEVTTSNDRSVLTVSDGDSYVSTRLVDGSWPDFNAFINRERPLSITIGADDLERAIRFAIPTSAIELITLTPTTDEELTISSTGETGTATSTIPAEITITNAEYPEEILFDSVQLLRTISDLSGKITLMVMTPVVGPARFTCDADDRLERVLMPRTRM